MSRGSGYGVNETSTETSRTQCDSGACVHVEEEGTYSHSGSEERSSESAVQEILRAFMQGQAVLVVGEFTIRLLDRASLVNVKECCATKIESVGARSGEDTCPKYVTVRVSVCRW